MVRFFFYRLLSAKLLRSHQKGKNGMIHINIALKNERHMIRNSTMFIKELDNLIYNLESTDLPCTG